MKDGGLRRSRGVRRERTSNAAVIAVTATASLLFSPWDMHASVPWRTQVFGRIPPRLRASRTGSVTAHMWSPCHAGSWHLLHTFSIDARGGLRALEKRQ